MILLFVAFFVLLISLVEAVSVSRRGGSLLQSRPLLVPRPEYILPRCTELSRFPQHYTCGSSGFLKDEHTFRELDTFAGSQIVPDFETCRNWCLHRALPLGKHFPEACKFFSYNHESGKCSFYNRRPGRQFVPNKMSKTSFWDPRCFDCPLRCPQPSINLIDDGGFEHGPKYRGPWSSPTGSSYIEGRVVSPGFNSNHAWKCSDGICTLLQYRTLCPGHMYKVDLDYKIVSSAAPSQFSITFGDALYAQSLLNSNASGWRHAEFTFRALYQLELLTIDYLPSCYTCGQGVLIDNVRLLPFSDSLPVETKMTWLPFENGDFESGLLAPWHFVRYGGEGSHSIVSPGLVSGSKFAFKYVSSTERDRRYDNFRLQHSLPELMLRRTYRLRFNYKVTGLVNFNVFVGGMQWNLLDPLGIMNHVNKSIVPAQNEAVMFERFFTCADTKNQFAVEVVWNMANEAGRAERFSANEVVYFDSFSIDEVA